MSKLLIGSSLLIVLNICGQAQSPVPAPVPAPAPPGAGNANPILGKYAENITFYLNFDEGNYIPAMAKGQQTNRGEDGIATFEKGLFGKCLRTGRPNYYSDGNLDMSAPGTLIVWVSPWQWKQIEVEDYFWPFIAFTDTSKIQLGRMRGAWGSTRIYAYLTAPDKKNNLNLGFGGGSGKDWKSGEWHMLVLTWTPESIGLSVDGSKLVEQSIAQPLGSKPGFFFIGAAATEKEVQLLQDEVTILNKKLSDDEIKSLYEETLKATGK